MGLSPQSVAIKGYHASKVAIKVVGITTFATSAFGLCMYVATSIAENKQMGFTISVNDPNKTGIGENPDEYVSISLSENEEFLNPTTNLFPLGCENITNISGRMIGDEVDAEDGSHNGQDYVAYSFYCKNIGTIQGNIVESMEIITGMKALRDSMRIRFYRNGVSETYASLGSDGNPEFGTVPFETDSLVFTYTSEYSANQINRYTIVIWLEGDDPECTNELMGSEIKFSLTFSVADKDSGSSDGQQQTE